MLLFLYCYYFSLVSSFCPEIVDELVFLGTHPLISRLEPWQAPLLTRTKRLALKSKTTRVVLLFSNPLQMFVEAPPMDGRNCTNS